MKRAYKYKLKPTVKQQNMLLHHFGCARFISKTKSSGRLKQENHNEQMLNFVQA